jgi:hypothetical protein
MAAMHYLGTHRFIEGAKTASKLAILVASCLVDSTVAPAGRAQRASAKPIRVQSEQVLVPVFVWDERRWNALLLTRPIDAQPYEEVPIKGLAAPDFQVLEDGREQRLEKVTPEAPSVLEVRDSGGQHFESETSAGKWIYPDIAKGSGKLVAMTWPTYLLAYTPPPSAEGSCHQVDVKVMNHPYAAAFSRTSYCRTTVSGSDLLNGTALGKRMEADLAKPDHGQIELSLAAVSSFVDADVARVHVSLGFDSKSLHYEVKYGVIGELHETIGMLGIVYDKEGSLVTRWSDFDCCDYSNGAGLDWLIVRNPGGNILFSPSGYETQVYLPAGEYSLRIVLTDGAKFGRAEIPLKIERRDAEAVYVGALCVAKRSREVQGAPSDVASKRVESYVPLIGNNLEITPAVEAKFRKHEPLFYYFEVYLPRDAEQKDCTGGRKCAKPLVAQLRIVDAASGEIKKELHPINVLQNMQGAEAVAAIAGKIGVEKLRRGEYRLEVQATDATGRATGWHAAEFRVE